MKKVFITGNAGSGKSAFRGFLEKHCAAKGAKWSFVDLDALAKQVCAAEGIATKRGGFEIFEDWAALTELEAKVWPPLAKALAALEAEAAAEGKVGLAVEASTFFEAPGLSGADDCVVLVSSSRHQSMCAERDGSERRAKAIAGVQISMRTKSLLADETIDNDGSLDDLSRRAEALAEALVRMGSDEAARVEARAEALWMECFGNRRVWDRIAKAYGRPSRHHHGLAHAEWMASKLESLPHGLDALWLSALRLAIWGHDAEMDIGVPGRGLDEELSCRFLWENARETGLLAPVGGARSAAALACELILCTKGHDISAPILEKGSGRRAAELLLDLDLAVLGADEARYDRFEKEIRAEWAGVSDEAFRVGRLAVLERLSGREKIFRTPEFSGLETAAKKNLERAKARLSIGLSKES